MFPANEPYKPYRIFAKALRDFCVWGGGSLKGQGGMRFNLRNCIPVVIKNGWFPLESVGILWISQTWFVSLFRPKRGPKLAATQKTAAWIDKDSGKWRELAHELWVGFELSGFHRFGKPRACKTSWRWIRRRPSERNPAKASGESAFFCFVF